MRSIWTKKASVKYFLNLSRADGWREYPLDKRPEFLKMLRATEATRNLSEAAREVDMHGALDILIYREAGSGERRR